MADAILTQERLKELLHYNPETGIFTWINPLSKIKKSGDVAGSLHHSGYIQIKISKKLYTAHRLAFLYMNGSFPYDCVDHINGKKDFNAWSNLRQATKSENHQNYRKHKSSNKLGVLGVIERNGKFHSCIRIFGKTKHIGVYKTPDEAHQAYLEFKRKFHSFCTI